MSERRPPYTAANKPRAPLSPAGEKHPLRQRLAALDAENEALVKQSLARAGENSALRRRLAALRPEYVEGLEAAAYEVCVWQDGGLLISRDEAIRELARLIVYPGWYQL